MIISYIFCYKRSIFLFSTFNCINLLSSIGVPSLLKKYETFSCSELSLKKIHTYFAKKIDIFLKSFTVEIFYQKQVL